MKTVETQAALVRGVIEMPFMVPLLEAVIDGSMFDNRMLGALYRGIESCSLSGVAVNQASVLQAVRDLNLLTHFKEGEADYYTVWLEVECFEPHLKDEEAVTAAAGVIRKAAIVKRLREVLYEGATRIGKDSEDPITEACKVSQAIDDLVQGSMPGIERVTHLNDALVSRLDLYKELRACKRPIFGLSTGFSRIDQITNGLQPSRFYMLGGWFAQGKALAWDCGVLTPNGWVKIGRLEAGDVILGPNGDWRAVIGVYPQGRKEIFTVKTNDGGETKCCAEHLWFTTSYSEHRAGKPGSVKTTAKITASLRDHAGRLNHILPNTGCMEFEDRGPLPLHPYLMGILLGDGGFSQGTIKFYNPEIDIQEALVRHLPDGDKVVALKRGDDFRIIKKVGRAGGPIGSETSKALKTLGLKGLLSHEKFIPLQYLRASVAERRLLLQGLLDTDGYVASGPAVRGDRVYENTGSTVEFSTSSLQLARDVIELTRSVGGITKVYDKIPTYMYKGKKLTGKRSYRVTLRFPNDWIPVTSSKHLAKWRPCSKRRYQRRIESIKSAGTAECVCIAVDAEDGLFVTDDYLVTHNSTVSFMIASHIAVQENEPVALVIFESSTGELVEKWLAQSCGISIHALHNEKTKVQNRWSLDAFRELAAQEQDVDKLKFSRLRNIIVIEAGGMTVKEVEGILHQINRERTAAGLKSIAAVFWDYIQITEVRGTYANREQEISQIGRDLVNLSMRMQIPVIGLSQIAAPEVNYSRESRALQGHCHSFWIIRISKEFIGDPANGLNKAALWMEKNRDAPSRVNIPMAWDGRRQIFTELTSDQDDSAWPQPTDPKDAKRWSDSDEWGTAVAPSLPLGR